MDDSNQSNKPAETPSTPTEAPKQPETNGYQTTPPVKPQSKKGLIIALSCIGGVIVLVGAFLLLWFLVLAGPSKQDYRDAQSKAKGVAESYQALEREVSNASSGVSRYSAPSESTINTKYDQLNNAFSDYKTAVENLKDQKAWRDKEVGDLYDSFTSQNKKFESYVDGVLGSYKPFMLVSARCNAINSYSSSYMNAKDPTAEYKKTVKPCTDAINQAQNLPDESFNALAKEMQSYFSDLEGYVSKAAAAAKKKSSSDYYKVSSEMSSRSTSYSQKVREISKGITDRGNSSEVDKQLNALGKKLTSKANGQD